MAQVAAINGMLTLGLHCIVNNNFIPVVFVDNRLHIVAARAHEQVHKPLMMPTCI